MYVLIPAYCPDERLLGIVSELLLEPGYTVVVVDDGSGGEYSQIFNSLSADFESDRVIVLHHEENRGKGRAIKTGLAHIKTVAGENDGIITVDADGQHLPSDAKRVAKVWQQNPAALVIGSRRFTGKVPLRSRAGNSITRGIFAITTGVRVYDTQSGLRAYAVKYIDEMLEIGGNRYEFEINQLLYAAKYKMPIIEETIETVYTPGNRSSHFKVFKDSWLIYKMIFAFMLSSFSCFLLDYALLLILSAVFESLPSSRVNSLGERVVPVPGFEIAANLLALILARSVSSFCNYLINRKMVFKSKGVASIIRYYLVIVLMMLINYGLLALVANEDGMPLWLAQPIVQLVIYPLNFVLQRKFVFPTKEKAMK